MDWKYLLTSFDGRINRAKFWAAVGVFIALGVIGLILDSILGTRIDLGNGGQLGIVGLISTALYALPRTSLLGAILLTAYMGGAIATNVRVDNPLFSHTLFGVYLSIMLWGGLFLRDPRVRALIPFSR